MEVFKKIRYVTFFLLMLIILISSCKTKEFNVKDLIIVPKGYRITVENNPEKNSELKTKWHAEDVAYLVYEPNNRENAKYILTIAEYQKQDYNAWLNVYFGDKTVQYNKEEIATECSFSSLFEKNVQICRISGVNNQTGNPYSIHKYTFGLTDTLIVRILCLEANDGLSNKHCRELALALINRAKELKLELG